MAERYFTWESPIWDSKIKRYDTIDEAIANAPKGAKYLKRVIKTNATNMYCQLVNGEMIDNDVRDKRIDKAQGEIEKKAYLAWCKGSTVGCVPASVGSIPTASTKKLKMEPI